MSEKFVSSDFIVLRCGNHDLISVIVLFKEDVQRHEIQELVDELELAGE
jgi:hypothetical protein